MQQSQKKGPAEKQELGPPIDIIETVVFGITRFRYWIVPFALIGLLIGLAVALIKPNTYTSSSKLWVEWGDRANLSAEQNLGMSRQGGSNKKAGFGMSEELQLIKTPEFFERIAREVGPEKLIAPIDPTRYDTPQTPVWVRWQHKFQDYWFNRGRKRDPEADVGLLNGDSSRALAGAVAMIRGGLKMRQSGSPNILGLTFKARSPELAQDVVEAATKVCLERHREIFAGRFKPEFVEAQLQEASQEARVASEEYSKHQKDCGFYDIAGQKTMLLNEQMALDDKIRENDLALDDAAETKAHLEAELAELPERVMKTFDKVEGPNPLYVELTGKAREYERQLATLPLEYPEGSDALERRQAALQAKLDAVNSQLADTPRIVELSSEHQEEIDNPERKEIQRKLRELELTKDKLLARDVKFHERRKEVEEELDALTACAPEHQAMEATIRKARQRAANFQSALDTREARILLDEDQDLQNMWVMLEATYNPQKTGPERMMNVLMGLAAGIAAGLAFGVFRQLIDSKLRYPSSVQKMLGVPVLGVIPEQRTWRRAANKIKHTGSPA